MIRSDIATFRRRLLSAVGLLVWPSCYWEGQVEAQQAVGEFDTGMDPDDTTTASDSGGTTSQGDPLFGCEDPQVIAQLSSGNPSGFVRCADGLIHRVESVAADQPAYHTSPCVDPGDGAGCVQDTDCTLDPHGMCLQRNDVSPSHDPQAYCFCDYGCQTDDDCSLEGYICAPVGAVEERGRCIPANCQSDDDCASGMCALTLPLPENVCYGTPPYEGGELVCKTVDDECRLDSDCPPDLDPKTDYVRCQGLVNFDRFVCNSLTCQDPGRPFLVAGIARVAPLTTGTGWSANTLLRPDMANLDAATRQDLAAYWREVGGLEHASIASFSRFVLQLMAVGAPADLVDEALAAGRDEVEHARLAWSLARAYGDNEVRPQGLAVDGALADTDLLTVVRHTLHEACINETVAALEAQEAWLCADDPAVEQVLAQIAHDEFRHAALGWRFVAWAIGQGGARVRDLVQRELAYAFELLPREASPREPGPQLDLSEHGVLSPTYRDRLRIRAMHELVRPLAGSLLGSRRPVDGQTAIS